MIVMMISVSLVVVVKMLEGLMFIRLVVIVLLDVVWKVWFREVW